MTRLAAMCGTALALFISAAPANAQATRTWVSGVGDDLNPCSRTAPCKTFAGAITKTATGGEINCLDNGAFGAVTIGKALTIKCETNEAGVLATLGSNGIIVNAPAADIVTLIGLDIYGAGTGLNGIRFIAGAALHVVNCKIHGFRNVNGNGILVNPTTGTLELYVSDSFIADNGNSNTAGGIVVKPTGSGSVNVTINRTQVENNSVGIRFDGSAPSGVIKGLVRDSMVAGNTNNGITVNSAGTVVSFIVDNVGVAGNAFGLVAAGSGADLKVNNSSIIANGTGVAPLSGGSVFTYGTNNLNGNTSDGAFTLPKLGQQ